MAKDKIDPEEVDETKVKPSEETEASEKNESSADNVTGKDIDNVLMVLNEIDQISGGKGAISSLPPELKGPVKFLIEKMVVIRDAFDDPLFKDVLDDMADQKQEGQVPSLLVAVARNVPMEELQKVADDENYEDVQGAVNDRVSKEKESEASDKKLYGNFDQSKKNIDAYCTKQGFDDTHKQQLYATISMLRNCFADGLISEEEAAKIDKINNYDPDMESMKDQVPPDAVKTVLPDKASIDESMTQKKVAPTSSPNSISGMSFNTQPSYLNTGKRKFVKG